MGGLGVGVHKKYIWAKMVRCVIDFSRKMADTVLFVWFVYLNWEK